MITLIKFVISYAASLFAFIFGWFLISYIFHPSFIHPNVVLGFIKTIVTYGSIPVLIACLIGDVLYRKIKRCREFQFGIPVFIGLAVIYTLIPFLLLFPFNFPHFFDFVAPVIMGALSFYLIRRKI
ncbi:hypothetical protein [Bacillus wiedmannii]|uniref:Group-specific protein n=1 Tax=Bacillus wiedmannii TaxID=1890302 RepID=A0A2A7BL63_9BACI|nr:hypothetical protein [Bacillus wiedmannii]KMP77766.1 hypothetical protein TU62_02435 [Bacillus cereus]MCQ6545251.1 hypothetical protein [Bacillus wiedmannii]MCQ6574690.1 hypothetical protein [Bacillus wiedmannii]MCU5578775.1 hypothetical protein [Bacillus wiedmannii]PDY35774.1 hypothetical protein COO17_25570 [Bacillus wiedmannii]